MLVVEKYLVLAATLVVLSLTGCATAVPAVQDQGARLYELRTYTTLPGRLPALEKRFADHTMRLFEKHGMRNEMYWVPTDDDRKDNTLIYVLSHESREAAERSWKAFVADPEWIKARDASEADGPILSKAPERVYMTRTPYSPKR